MGAYLIHRYAVPAGMPDLIRLESRDPAEREARTLREIPALRPALTAGHPAGKA